MLLLLLRLLLLPAHGRSLVLSTSLIIDLLFFEVSGIKYIGSHQSLRLIISILEIRLLLVETSFSLFISKRCVPNEIISIISLR
jgi:hypothetical protein